MIIAHVIEITILMYEENQWLYLWKAIYTVIDFVTYVAYSDEYKI